MSAQSASHHERERKFEATDDVTLPHADRFTALDGVDVVDGAKAVELEATYHDTDDLRLLRGGVTLRRRTGGDDAGWHLKLPEALDVRLELQRPLGRGGRPPKALRDLVLARTREVPLAPVAVLRTRRTSCRLLGAGGRPLVEIADDHVRADADGSDPVVWREVEVEVVGDGVDEAVLDGVAALLEDAGATPSAAPSKLAVVLGDRLRAAQSSSPSWPDEGMAGAFVLGYLAAQRDELVRLDPLVRHDVPDSVHKMRVAIRRLRSALRTYRRLLDRDVTDPLRDELKWLGGVLGPVRDAEVITARIEQLLDDEPPALVVGPARRRLRSVLGAEQRSARAAMLEELAGGRYLRLLDELDRVVAGGALRDGRARKPARKQVRTALRRQHDRWERCVDAANALAAGADEHLDEALHEVRKASKRVRYGAESATPVFGGDADDLAEQMEDLQDLLGEHQDTVVTRAVLLRLAASGRDDGDDTFTWGRLHAREQATAQDTTRRFLDDVERDVTPPTWLT